jgi:hypothetical protein
MFFRRRDHRHGERLGPDHIRILPAGREDSMPPVLAPDPWPANTDLLHRVLSP